MFTHTHTHVHVYSEEIDSLFSNFSYGCRQDDFWRLYIRTASVVLGYSNYEFKIMFLRLT